MMVSENANRSYLFREPGFQKLQRSTAGQSTSVQVTLLVAPLNTSKPSEVTTI